MLDPFQGFHQPTQKFYEVDYEPLSQAAVEPSMQDNVEHICGTLGVEVSHCRLIITIMYSRTIRMAQLSRYYAIQSGI